MSEEINPRDLTSGDFDLNITENEEDAFKWLMLCLLFGKPLHGSSAFKSWQYLLEAGYDNPWILQNATRRDLLPSLHKGGFKRYDNSTVRVLNNASKQLIDQYEGSVNWIIQSSESEEELQKRLQSLYGVGPKVAEIFTREIAFTELHKQ